MMNDTIKEMVNNNKSGIITIENDTYYFDGYMALPIKCQCGGDITKYTEGWNRYRFNESLGWFEDHIDGEDQEISYNCGNCDKELSELYPDIKKGIWE